MFSGHVWPFYVTMFSEMWSGLNKDSDRCFYFKPSKPICCCKPNRLAVCEGFWLWHLLYWNWAKAVARLLGSFVYKQMICWTSMKTLWAFVCQRAQLPLSLSFIWFLSAHSQSQKRCLYESSSFYLHKKLPIIFAQCKTTSRGLTIIWSA